MHPIALTQNHRDRSVRIQLWGVGLLVAATAFWLYAAWQVFVPYGSTYNAVDCPAPVNADPRDIYYDLNSSDTHADALQCAADRDWPSPLSALVISVPLAVAGGVSFAVGAAGVRGAAYAEAMRQAQD